MEAPEAPHSQPSHTGHCWLDIVLGLSAMFLSVVSLVVAVEHPRTMERMADANTRMLDANSWPFRKDPREIIHPYRVDRCAVPAVPYQNE
jgi:hypothetical protein